MAKKAKKVAYRYVREGERNLIFGRGEGGMWVLDGYIDPWCSQKWMLVVSSH
jgi:hypothetical protein